MRVTVNPATRNVVADDGDVSTETVAQITIVTDGPDGLEVNYNGRCTESEYDAIIAELEARRSAVWS